MPVIHLSEGSFKKEVLNSEVPTLVDFYTTWCGPCKLIAPIIEEIAKDYNGKLKVTKLNIEEASNIATQYSIMSVPTLFIFNKGKVVDQIIGAASKRELKKKIDAAIV